MSRRETMLRESFRGKYASVDLLQECVNVENDPALLGGVLVAKEEDFCPRTEFFSKVAETGSLRRDGKVFRFLGLLDDLLDGTGELLLVEYFG